MRGELQRFFAAVGVILSIVGAFVAWNAYKERQPHFVTFRADGAAGCRVSIQHSSPLVVGTTERIDVVLPWERSYSLSGQSHARMLVAGAENCTRGCEILVDGRSMMRSTGAECFADVR